jgi:hypothetical protein
MWPKRTTPYVSRALPIPQKSGRLRDAFSCSSSKGLMYTVHGILIFIKRLSGVCLQSLHQRFVSWTKPDTTSLLLETLTDLARSKFELVAENVLLRKPLIILQRQVKRPARTKTDRMLLVLLARRFGPGNKPCSLSGQRRFYGGIARVFGSSGNTNPELLLPNQR